MGLSSFPSAGEGILLPVIVINTLLSFTSLKNMLRAALHFVIGATSVVADDYEQNPDFDFDELSQSCARTSRERRVSTTQFKSLFHDNNNNDKDGGSCSNVSWRVVSVECCVCLCSFEAEEEVSELSCKHFFHKCCLDKWFFDCKRTTCPLCRSAL